jgi:hypothetical protein
MRWLEGRSCTLPTWVQVLDETLARCDKARRISTPMSGTPLSGVSPHVSVLAKS